MSEQISRDFSMIALVDRQWAIGKDGRQILTIPQDMQMFRRATMGRIVVMGRKTFETFNIMKPLESRINVILTHRMDFAPDGAHVVHSLEEALSTIDRLLDKHGLSDEDVMIIGGDHIYHQFFPYCSQALITAVDYTYDADTYMVNLEKEGWILEQESPEQTVFDLVYHYRLYRRPAPAGNGGEEC